MTLVKFDSFYNMLLAIWIFFFFWFIALISSAHFLIGVSAFIDFKCFVYLMDACLCDVKLVSLTGSQGGWFSGGLTKTISCWIDRYFFLFFCVPRDPNFYLWNSVPAPGDRARTGHIIALQVQRRSRGSTAHLWPIIWKVSGLRGDPLDQLLPYGDSMCNPEEDLCMGKVMG